jgi:DNA topoisomerase-1
MMRIIKMKTGRSFIGCSNYPNCTNTYSLPQGVKITGAGGKCSLCKAPMIRGFAGGRKVFEICPNPACKQEDEKTPSPGAGSATATAQKANPPLQKTAALPQKAAAQMQKAAAAPAQKAAPPLPESSAATKKPKRKTVIKKPKKGA